MLKILFSVDVSVKKDVENRVIIMLLIFYILLVSQWGNRYENLSELINNYEHIVKFCRLKERHRQKYKKPTRLQCILEEVFYEIRIFIIVGRQ